MHLGGAQVFGHRRRTSASDAYAAAKVTRRHHGRQRLPADSGSGEGTGIAAPCEHPVGEDDGVGVSEVGAARGPLDMVAAGSQAIGPHLRGVGLERDDVGTVAGPYVEAATAEMPAGLSDGGAR